jgi:hypothetical protein
LFNVEINLKAESMNASTKEKTPVSPTPRQLKAVPKLNYLKDRGFTNNDWTKVAPLGYTVEDLCDPAYWAIYHTLLHPYDIVSVVSRDRKWWAEFLIVGVSISGAQTVLLRKVDLPAIEPDRSDRLPPGYSFKDDPEVGLILIRDRDGVKMGDSITNNWNCKEDAVRYLLDHASLRSD